MQLPNVKQAVINNTPDILIGFFKVVGKVLSFAGLSSNDKKKSVYDKTSTVSSEEVDTECEALNDIGLGHCESPCNPDLYATLSWTEMVVESGALTLLNEGKKVLAIKKLREASGLGLKEAKAAVESYCEHYEISAA